MKPGTTAKLKFLELKTALAIPKWQTMGLLESLWEFVTENCPDGDIGRFSPAQIALALEYQSDADALIDALITARWLDRDSDGKLWVHNWAIHRAHFVTDRAELRYLRNIPRPCGFCEVEFHPTHERSKFCSPACRQANHRQKAQQITQCNAECNAVTHVTQSNANVTHSPVPFTVTVTKKEEGGTAPKPEWPLKEFPKVSKAYKTLWADIKGEHPAVEYPSRDTKEGRHKHQKAAEVISQVLRIDGITEARFLEVWRWLFDSDDTQAVFWRKQCQSLEQLRKKKSGDTLNRFQKITGEFDRVVKVLELEYVKPRYNYKETEEYREYQAAIDDPNTPEKVKIRARELQESMRYSSPV